ncbi:MAG: hypothetical protein QXG86_01165 [Candidatus Woesearchaeota archaeon]
MEKKEVEKTLSEIGKKYNIKIEELEREFEIIDLFVEKKELPNFPLRVIRRRIVDVCSLWAGYLHNFIIPNPHSMVSLKDSEVFNDKEKEKIYKLLTKFSKITKESTILEIQNDEKAEALFIRENLEYFKEIKKELEFFIQKDIDFWRKECE